MRKDLFEELDASVKEMKAIERGTMTPARVTRSQDLWAWEVRSVRARFKLSQGKFAALMGVSVDTLQNWEQARREPDGPANVLLMVAVKHPEVLLSVSGEPPVARAHKRKARASR